MSMYALDMYQAEAQVFASFPKENWDKYLPLNLAGEAGEVVSKFAKTFRGDKPLDYDAVMLELGDTLWHIAVLAAYMGYDLSEVAQRNIEKLADRQHRGVIAGEGDNR